MWISLSEKQINAILSMEKQLWYWESYSWCVRSFSTQQEFSEYFSLLQKKLKKQQRYKTAKKNWTLKEKIRTVQKIVFYISKLIEKYWQIYTEKSLLQKFRLKKIPLDLSIQALQEVKNKWILNEQYCIESFIHRKLQAWKWKSFIKLALLKKWVPDWFDLDSYFDEFLYDKEQLWLEKQINKLKRKYDFNDFNELEYSVQTKIVKSLLSKWYSYKNIKQSLSNT